MFVARPARTGDAAPAETAHRGAGRSGGIAIATHQRDAADEPDATGPAGTAHPPPVPKAPERGPADPPEEADSPGEGDAADDDGTARAPDAGPAEIIADFGAEAEAEAEAAARTAEAAFPESLKTDDGTAGAGGKTERRPAQQVELSGFGELKAVLRIRPFRRLWLVLGVAALGDWLGLLATSVFAAQQVSGTAAKGLVFGGVIAVRLLPALVLGPIAGVLADRFDRRYTMVVCDIIRFVLFASIPAAAMITANPAIIVAWTAIANFIIESVTMAWLPAKDAAVPNLLPRARLETANQLTLATTYGVTPVAAALALAGMTAALSDIYARTGQMLFNPVTFALLFLAVTRLASAIVVLFWIKEISGRTRRDPEGNKPGMLREFIDGWKYLGTTPLVRGLVLGILAAFSGGGMVIGTANFYARSLGGGDSTFYILFAMLFVGLAVGIVAGPKMIGALSRRRWFGLSIMLAGAATGLMAFAWHLSMAIIFVILVGIAAGMAFLSGTTLLGSEVADDVRGRVFGFVNMATRVVLMLAIALSSAIVGVGGSRELSVGIGEVPVSTSRLLLLAAGVVGIFAGIGAFRQMDDKPGVPIFADLIGSLRGRPLGVPEIAARPGIFVVFEGGEGAGKSTQVERLAAALRTEGYDVVVTREPGATEVGARIRSLVLDRRGGEAEAPAPRAEALLYAADRAHHVATLVRPSLARGHVVISDRYVDSSLAYQGAGRTLPVEEISWLSQWATGGLRPDLVILLDVDPAVGLARVGNRGRADRLEAESVSFHERVRYAFLDLAAEQPSRYLILDAELPPDVISSAVVDRVRPLLPGLTRGGDDGWSDEVPAPPPLDLPETSAAGRMLRTRHTNSEMDSRVG